MQSKKERTLFSFCVHTWRPLEMTHHSTIRYSPIPSPLHIIQHDTTIAGGGVHDKESTFIAYRDWLATLFSRSLRLFNLSPRANGRRIAALNDLDIQGGGGEGRHGNSPTFVPRWYPQRPLSTYIIPKDKPVKVYVREKVGRLFLLSF